MTGISLGEFAERVGMRLHSIRAAVLDGRIPPNLIDEQPMKGGRTKRMIRDPVAAERALKANTDPAKRGAAKNPEWKPSKPAASARHEDGNDGDNDDDGGPVHAKNAPKIVESRAVTEAYKARMARLEYEEAAGKLVNAEEFRTKFATLITTARTHMMAVPSKAKGRIPHLSIDDIAVLNQLIREALEDLSRAR